MKRYAWLTDIHLDFVTPDKLVEFLSELAGCQTDGILIGGDICEAFSLRRYLPRIAQDCHTPVYFVLGNHDYYGSSIVRVRAVVKGLCREEPRLHYLTLGDIVELSPTVGLIGHDGWSDGRAGDYEHSDVVLNDYFQIEELAGPITKEGRLKVLNRLGDEAAEDVRQVLPKALEQYPEVVMLTHVPPFREACWYEGAISDDNWAPHFTGLAMGEMLLEVMQQYPDRKLTVLCGHTHGQGQARIRDNLQVLTGGAHYHAPQIQKVFQFE